MLARNAYCEQRSSNKPQSEAVTGGRGGWAAVHAVEDRPDDGPSTARRFGHCLYRGWPWRTGPAGGPPMAHRRWVGHRRAAAGVIKYDPCKHKHLYNVGPASKTLGRRCTNVIRMFCVCWDVMTVAYHPKCCWDGFIYLRPAFSQRWASISCLRGYWSESTEWSDCEIYQCRYWISRERGAGGIANGLE